MRSRAVLPGTKREKQRLAKPQTIVSPRNGDGKTLQKVVENKPDPAPVEATPPAEEIREDPMPEERQVPAEIEDYVQHHADEYAEIPQLIDDYDMDGDDYE